MRMAVTSRQGPIERERALRKEGRELPSRVGSREGPTGVKLHWASLS